MGSYLLSILQRNTSHSLDVRHGKRILYGAPYFCQLLEKPQTSHILCGNVLCTGDLQAVLHQLSLYFRNIIGCG